MEIIWNIPSLHDWDTLEELAEAMENFPDSPIYPIWLHTSQAIKAMLNISDE